MLRAGPDIGISLAFLKSDRKPMWQQCDELWETDMRWSWICRQELNHSFPKGLVRAPCPARFFIFCDSQTWFFSLIFRIYLPSLNLRLQILILFCVFLCDSVPLNIDLSFAFKMLVFWMYNTILLQPIYFLELFIKIRPKAISLAIYCYIANYPIN